MGPWLRAVVGVLWPPAAPADRRDRAGRLWWALCCAANVIPLTAALHHAVFFRPSCILNPSDYGGNDYTWPVIRGWLAHDPSLPAAVGLTVVAFLIGTKLRWVRLLGAPFFLS